VKTPFLDYDWISSLLKSNI